MRPRIAIEIRDQLGHPVDKLEQRPNILFITSDQQRWDHTGLTGLPGLPTPALDRIGREGVWFSRAYCPAPVCTPTRLSWLTGLYPSLHGSHTLGVTADPFPQPTLAERLQAAGYRTCLVGKSHFTERRLEEAHLLQHIGAYRDDPEFPFDGPYVGFDAVQLASGHTANTVPAMHYRRFLERAGVDFARWFPLLHSGTYDQEYAGAWNLPEAYHSSTWIGEQSEQWLRRVMEPDSQQPWFCWMSFEDPHEPMYCPEPWFSRVDRDALQPFAGDREGEFEDKPPFYAEAAAGDWGRTNDIETTPCVYPRRRLDRVADVALQATVGMIGLIDDRVGRVIRLLEDRGQLDQTLIVYTSDHGEMHGHHGFWGKGYTAYEDCQRVPLLIRAPWLIRRQGCRPEIVNTIDLPRLFLEAAGLWPVYGLQGAGLRAFLDGEAGQIRSGTLIESRLTKRLYQLTYVNQTHKIVVYEEESWGELYDLEADPDQYTNLWDRDPGLRGQLLQEMARQRMREEPASPPRLSFG